MRIHRPWRAALQAYLRTYPRMAVSGVINSCETSASRLPSRLVVDAASALARVFEVGSHLVERLSERRHFVSSRLARAHLGPPFADRFRCVAQ